MVNKRLKTLVEKLIVASIDIQGRINEKIAHESIQILKKLPLTDAMCSLNLYQKGLEREISRTTMEISSPVPISPGQKNKIITVAKKKFQINGVKMTIDPSLFGGLCIKIGDIVFDDSIKTKITGIKGVING